MSIGGFKIKRVILGPLEPDERSPLLSTSRDVAPRFQIKCVHPSTCRQMSTRHNLGPEFGLNSESTRKYQRGRGHEAKGTHPVGPMTDGKRTTAGIMSAAPRRRAGRRPSVYAWTDVGISVHSAVCVVNNEATDAARLERTAGESAARRGRC